MEANRQTRSLVKNVLTEDCPLSFLQELINHPVSINASITSSGNLLGMIRTQQKYKFLQTTCEDIIQRLIKQPIASYTEVNVAIAYS
jgi:hypothetical protein